MGNLFSNPEINNNNHNKNTNNTASTTRTSTTKASSNVKQENKNIAVKAIDTVKKAAGATASTVIGVIPDKDTSLAVVGSLIDKVNPANLINTFFMIGWGSRYYSMNEKERKEFAKTKSFYSLPIKTKGSHKSIWDFNSIFHRLYLKLKAFETRVKMKLDQKELVSKIYTKFIDFVRDGENVTAETKRRSIKIGVERLKTILLRVLKGPDEDNTIVPKVYSDITERASDVLTDNFKRNTDLKNKLREPIFKNIHKLFAEADILFTDLANSADILIENFEDLWNNPSEKVNGEEIAYGYFKIQDLIIFLSVALELRFEAEIFFFEKKDFEGKTLRKTWGNWLYKKGIDCDITSYIRKSGHTNAQAIEFYKEQIVNIKKIGDKARREKENMLSCITVLQSLIIKNNRIDETIIGDLPVLTEKIITLISEADSLKNNNEIVVEIGDINHTICMENWSYKKDINEFVERLNKGIETYNSSRNEEDRINLVAGSIGNPASVQVPEGHVPPGAENIHYFIEILGWEADRTYHGETYITLQNDLRYNILGDQSSLNYIIDTSHFPSRRQKQKPITVPGRNEANEEIEIETGELQNICPEVDNYYSLLGPINMAGVETQAKNQFKEFYSVTQPTVLTKIFNLMGKEFDPIDLDKFSDNQNIPHVPNARPVDSSNI